MAKYIDKEPLVQEIKEFKQAVQSANTDYLTGYLSALSVAQGMIAKQDIADVVQVVRCKDCKWYNIFRLECYKPHRNGVSWIDDFCSYGERKENG